MRKLILVGLLVPPVAILFLVAAYVYEYLWIKYGYVPTKCSLDDSGN